MATPHAGNPFLQAVTANPDDDLTRLVYADWLDENGQPERAEFIRVQVALAAGEPDTRRRHHLEDRQRELLIAHDTEWVRELAEVLQCPPGRWGGWVFRRGFVEYFHLPGLVVVRNGAALAQLTPVRELYLNPATTTDLIDLCRQPWFAAVWDLYLVIDGPNVGDETGLRGSGLWELLTSPHAVGVKKLVAAPLAASVTENAGLLDRMAARFGGEWQR